MPWRPGRSPGTPRGERVLLARRRGLHKTFGPGKVLSVSGDTIEVKFTRTGKTKKLLKGFAPLVKIEG